MKKTSFLLLLPLILLSAAAMPGETAQKAFLNEGFEEAAIPSYWTLHDNDGSGTSWQVLDASSTFPFPYGGDYVARSGDASLCDDWLITPPLICAAGVPDTLVFWATSYIALADLEVRISSTGTDIGDFGSPVYAVDNHIVTWTKHRIPLDTHDGDTVYVAVINTSTSNNNLWVDEFTGPPAIIPSGAISGTVSQAKGPIEGAIVTATGYTIASDTTDISGHYLIESLPIGSYEVTASATDHFPFTEHDVVVLENDTTSVDFTLIAYGSHDVLLVDADGSAHSGYADVRSTFTDALDSSGYTYDVVEKNIVGQDGPDYYIMQNYDVVVWFTGQAFSNSTTLTANDEIQLGLYLDAGGRLFLSAQDYLWDRYTGAGSFSPGQFPYDYLGVSSTIQDVCQFSDPFTGHADGYAGSVADGMSFDLWDPFSAKGIIAKSNNTLFIDELSILGDPVFQVTAPDSVAIAACQYAAAKGFKTFFTTVSFAGLVDGAHTKADLMAAIIDWLSAPVIGTLAGTVSQARGPIEGAIVTAEGDTTASDTTDSIGNYLIENLPLGLYDVTASATGYISSTNNDVTVFFDSTTHVDFFLNPWTSDLSWSTFLGGANYDYGEGIAMDASGHTYVTGQTLSSDFPTTAGAYDETYESSYDAFVVKLNLTGSGFEYATFLGGNGGDYGNGIAVDASDKVYLTGKTASSNFPVTSGALDETYNGSIDAFVVKLNTMGSDLEYGTFVGGGAADEGNGIAVDASGGAFFTGRTLSTDFPTTTGAYDTTHNGNYEAFAAKLNSSGNILDYCTYLGGSDRDEGTGVTMDGSGQAYVTGFTWSLDFPTTSGAWDTLHDGVAIDGFVTKLNATGENLVYSTLLGGSADDRSYGIALYGSSQAYVIGYTVSSNFPTTPGAYDETKNGSNDVFITKINPTGSGLTYSTFLGGSNTEYGRAIVTDGSGNAYVAGYTSSTDFPTTSGVFDTTHNGGGEDVFVAKLNSTGSALSYSTFLGGDDSDYGTSIAIDGSGKACVTGYTLSANFPASWGSFDHTHNGNTDAFVAHLDIGAVAPDLTPPEAIDDLSIAVENLTKSGDIRLIWSDPGDDVGVTRYLVHRSATSTAFGDSLAGTTDTTYLDIGAIGVVDTNYCYLVRAVDGAGNKSTESNRVGEHDYQLSTTLTSTDYSWIALCLGDANLVTASDLEAHIEAHSSPPTDCTIISAWNPQAQSYIHYTTHPPGGNFPLKAGEAYRVVVNAAAVWTLVGDVLAVDSVSFELKTTPTSTNYNFVSIPLHLDSLQTAMDLEAHIDAQSSPPTDCTIISTWNPASQSYLHYTTNPPGGNFPVKPGGAYRVVISTEATWPVP